MTLACFPPDSLFIKFGEFQAGASGRWSIVALILLASGGGAFAARYFGMW
jgi:hypothetical protein